MDLNVGGPGQDMIEVDLDDEEIIEALERDEFEEQVEIGRAYGYSHNIRRIIQHLQEDDKVEVQVMLSGNPRYTLWVTKNHLEEVEAVDYDTGEMYRLLASYWGPQYRYDGNPWLRTLDNESRGEIGRLIVKEL